MAGLSDRDRVCDRALALGAPGRGAELDLLHRPRRLAPPRRRDALGRRPRRARDVRLAARTRPAPRRLPRVLAHRDGARRRARPGGDVCPSGGSPASTSCGRPATARRCSPSSRSCRSRCSGARCTTSSFARCSSGGSARPRPPQPSRREHDRDPRPPLRGGARQRGSSGSEAGHRDSGDCGAGDRRAVVSPRDAGLDLRRRRLSRAPPRTARPRRRRLDVRTLDVAPLDDRELEHGVEELRVEELRATSAASATRGSWRRAQTSWCTLRPRSRSSRRVVRSARSTSRARQPFSQRRWRRACGASC